SARCDVPSVASRVECAGDQSTPELPGYRELRERVTMDDPAAHVGERVLDDEGGRIEAVDDADDPTDLEARDDAVEDLTILAALAAARLVDGHAAAEIVEQRAADRRAGRRHDGDRRELLDAVQDEIEGARRGDVGEDRIERRLDAEDRHRGQEQHDVEAEDHVADLEHGAALADE